MKYFCRYTLKDKDRHLEKEQYIGPATEELEEITAGKNVIEKKVFRKATPDSTIVTHQWETEE